MPETKVITIAKSQVQQESVIYRIYKRFPVPTTLQISNLQLCWVFLVGFFFFLVDLGNFP